MLTIPTAVPWRWCGLNVLAKSNPIIEPGAPSASTTTSSTSNHRGAGGGTSSTAVHTAAVPTMTASTSHDRCSGRRAVNSPNNGPAMIPTATNSVSSALASAAVKPWPATRYGTPHSRAKTVPENWVPVCVHSPSRVPGSRQAFANESSTSRGVGGGRRLGGTGRPVAQHGDHSHPDRKAQRRRGRERRRPAGAVQQCGQRDGRQHLSQLADQAGELGHQRHAPGWEPRHDHGEHADERQRVTRADEHARRDRERKGRGHGQHQLARRHDHRSDDDEASRAEAVQEHARRHLQAGVDQELEHHEARQRRGRGVEAVRGGEARDTEGRALHDADEVGAQADDPDHPQARAGTDSRCIAIHRSRRSWPPQPDLGHSPAWRPPAGPCRAPRAPRHPRAVRGAPRPSAPASRHWAPGSRWR